MKVQPIALDDISAESSTVVSFFGRQVHVYFVDGAPRAVANVCLHLGGPLERKDGGVCPWHDVRFDMATGRRPTARRLKAPV